MTCPWFIIRENGSPNATNPMYCNAFVKNREYSRCRIACSTPPVYWSTGIHRSTICGSNGRASSLGEQYRKKYQDESTNVSIVSVSRFAEPPHRGHDTFTND